MAKPHCGSTVIRNSDGGNQQKNSCSILGIRSMFLHIMAETGDSSGTMGRGGAFPTTHWSVVLAAAQAGTPQADQALAKLCMTYWYPAPVRLAGRVGGT